MIRTLIVDDEQLARERIRTLLSGHDLLEVIGECGDGEQAIAAIEKQRPDLVFLDIQMPGADGFDVARALTDGPLPGIIFVTAFDQHALEAFEVNAIDYVLKPIRAERFAQAVDRAVQSVARGPAAQGGAQIQRLLDHVQQQGGYPRRFAVRSRSRIHFVRTRDIERIQAAANYVEVHVGGKVDMIRQTMKSLEQRLDPERFVRVHRSVIVNLDHVASLEACGRGEYTLTMHDGSCVNTGRSYGDRLRGLL